MKTREAARLFLSVVILLFPLLTLTTPFGVGLMEVCLLLGAILFIRQIWKERAWLFHTASFILFAFAFHLLVAFSSLHSFAEELNFLDNPFRQFLVVLAIGFMSYCKPKVDWFWYGLFLGTLAAAIFAVYQRFVLNFDRAGGYHLVIMFGDIAMAMGLMSLASVKRFAGTRIQLFPYLSFLFGFAASLLSEARGGWLALPLAALPFWRPEWRVSRVALISFLLSAGLLAMASLSSEVGVGQRLALVWQDLNHYRSGDVDTSVGLRLELWRGAWQLFLEHPLTGVGSANFNEGMQQLVARGALRSPVTGYHHAHNELLHALATQGLLGFTALMALYAGPLWFFVSRLRRPSASFPFAVAGTILVASTFLFGLTMVFFAHHVGAGYYAVALTVLCGICIAEEARAETASFSECDRQRPQNADSVAQ